MVNKFVEEQALCDFQSFWTLVRPRLSSPVGISNEILRLGFSSLQLHGATTLLPASVTVVRVFPWLVAINNAKSFFGMIANIPHHQNGKIKKGYLPYSCYQKNGYLFTRLLLPIAVPSYLYEQRYFFILYISK
jgi:hypothetical protein